MKAAVELFKDDFPALERAFARLPALRSTVTDDIVKKIDSLFARASNIYSMDEAYISRQQNQSVKRLSWVTVSRDSVGFYGKQG